MELPSPGSRFFYLLLASAILGGCADIPCGWIYPRAEELSRGGLGSQGFRLPRLGVLVSGKELPFAGSCLPVTPENFEVTIHGRRYPVQILSFYHVRFFVPLKPYPPDSDLEVRKKGCGEDRCGLLRVKVSGSSQPDLSPLPPFRFLEQIPGTELYQRLQGVSFTGGKKIGRDPELKTDRIELWVYGGKGEGGDPMTLYLLTPHGNDPPTPWVPVLYIHGFRSCKETVFAFADVAARFGIALFAFDLRGHGERALSGLPYECGTTLPWELFLSGDLSQFFLALKEGAEVAQTLIAQIQRGDFPGVAPDLPLGVLGHSLGGGALFFLMAEEIPEIKAYGFTASGIGYGGMLPFFLDPKGKRWFLSFLHGSIIGEMANEFAFFEPPSLFIIPPQEGYIFAQVMVSDTVLPPIAYETLIHTLSLSGDRSQDELYGFRLYDRIPRGHLGVFFPDHGVENRLIQWQIFRFFRTALLMKGREPIKIPAWDHPQSLSEVTAIYGNPSSP